MKDFVYEKIRTTAIFLNDKIVLDKQPLNDFDIIETGYKKDQRPPMPDGSWGKLNFSEQVFGVDRHYWVYKKITTPKKTSDHQDVYFDLRTGLEGQWNAMNPQCLFYVDGKLIQGLDTNHTDVRLEFDKEYDIHIHMHTGMKCPKFLFEASIKVVDKLIEGTYYDLWVPYESMELLDDKSDAYITTKHHLELACNILDLRDVYSDEFYASLSDCRKYLMEEYFEKECGKSSATVSGIGHTHIDVAWQWPLAQTEEKAQHSFSTVLKLIEEYPEYIFMSSQPQLYEYVKMYDEELYERIKKQVADGRFEPEGAMWLEADCNLSSGESFVRQVMFGKRFFKEEFGVDSKVLWLPDVFGYSAALPQILKKSGVDKFVTSKISWNEQNKLPYDTFMWEGLDGTEIFTSFITDQRYDPKNPDCNFTTYVGNITPSEVYGTNRRHQQKQYSNRGIITFGYGDGGGGTTRRMLEYYRRLKFGLPGLPKLVIEPAKDYLNKLEADFMESSQKLKKCPKWVGELYLEFHRGTYTSIAKNKKNNRDCEFLMQTAEQLSSAIGVNKNCEYPKAEIDACWKTILLNQFHDIIPGSSIKEVYDDSDVQYAKVRKTGNAIVDGAIEKIASGIDKAKGTVVYNPNSFECDGYAKINGKTVYVGKTQPLGWKTVENVIDKNNISVSDSRIENEAYIIDFDKNYNITSIYDKRYDRQVVKKGELANRIEVFEDLPYQYDNWELSAYYKQKKWYVDNVDGFEIIDDGARAGYKITRKYLNSTITQNIYVYDNSPRIDFETSIDWKQEHVVMKAAFPLDIHTDKATYETQFGYVERPTHENTSWDAAKFEVCAHKYADISEDDYGVALINNCKYGHNCEGSTLKLTMLKCGTFPYEDADKGNHEFTYSLVPHSGNHKMGGVVQESYLLNRPLIAVEATGDGKTSDSFSFVKCNKENVIIETVKKAEKEDAYVIRAYDAYNRKGKAEFTFGFDIKKAYVCDLMENKLCELEISDNRTVSLDVSNFEIVTIMAEK